MQKNLVIVESPAKAKTIEKFLGKDYKVMPSYGHIRDLKKKNFGVDLNTFEPEYEIPADKKKVVSELKAEAKKADAVWLASDEDREGEAISWHLAEVLGLDPEKSKRIVFHEITKPAVMAAIESPRHIDLNLVDAQQARRVLDRIVGFKLSPVLWRKVRPSLSAGRVQSVAVRLIVEREREINKFVPESSYRVTAIFRTTTGGKAAVKSELNRRFKTKAEAEAFLKECVGANFEVASVNTRPIHRSPAAPFTTSTLQQEAARKLGYPVALTMRVAQALYEEGLITYMRTDSMNLSELCLNACGPVIDRLMGKGYHKRRTYHTHSKGAQEAHEAIRPTDMARESIDGTPQQKKLYDLIWKRTIACQMADAQIEKTTVAIDVNVGSNSHEVVFINDARQFTANGEVVKFDGFLRVYKESETDESNAPVDSGMTILPPMEVGEHLQYSEVTAQQRFTQHPPRYTEASLVHKMEEMGIGRPSTYAPTISTIQQRGYVAKSTSEGEQRSYDMIVLSNGNISDETRYETVGNEKNKLVPTDVGLVVNDFLMEYFPGIMDYNFTANVEKDFDAIAEGRKVWTALMKSFYEDFEPQVEKTLAEKTDHKVGERILGNDPATGEPVMVKIGRYGPMAQIGEAGNEAKPRFATLKPNQSIETITLDEALDLFKLPRTLGEFEGKSVVVNAGRFGPYVHHDGKFVSIPKGEDPMSITLERAEELIAEKRKADAQKHIKSFDEDPDMEILNGRYGPYISYKKSNYKLPKAMHERAAELTHEECLKIIEAEPKKKTRTTAKRTRTPKKADA